MRVPPDEIFLTMHQVVTILNVHPNTLRRWDKLGYLTAVRIGPRRDRRFRREDIEGLAGRFGLVMEHMDVGLISLTDRQHRVAVLVLQNRTNHEIAEEMGLSLGAVSNTVAALRHKFRAINKRVLRNSEKLRQLVGASSGCQETSVGGSKC